MYGKIDHQQLLMILNEKRVFGQTPAAFAEKS